MNNREEIIEIHMSDFVFVFFAMCGFLSIVQFISGDVNMGKIFFFMGLGANTLMFLLKKSKFNRMKIKKESVERTY